MRIYCFCFVFLLFVDVIGRKITQNHKTKPAQKTKQKKLLRMRSGRHQLHPLDADRQPEGCCGGCGSCVDIGPTHSGPSNEPRGRSEVVPSMT